jgi:hypothetical protein
MRSWIARGDWQGLEAEYAERCRLVDPVEAAAIDSIDLAAYEDALTRALDRVGDQLDRGAAAVYWEFDIDNGWDSAFFMCPSYQPEAARDDDWASDFDPSLVVDGPAMPELAARIPGSWQGSEPIEARNLYLVARTVAAFGRASAAWGDRMPLCAGFHDQSIVFRVARSGVIGGH